MRKTSLVGVAVVAFGALAAVGCGSSGGSDVGLTELPGRFAETFCTKVFECCDATERMTELGLFDPVPTTVAECEEQYGAFINLFYSQEKAAVDAGKIVYHGDQAGACLDAAAGATCAEFHSDDGPAGAAACDQIFEGQVAAGGACNLDDECAGAATCVGGSQSEAGACVALPGSGDPCPDFDCQEGLYCKADGAAGTCAPTEADGQACVADSDCTSGFCDRSGASPVCAAAPVDNTCDGV